MDVPEGEGRTAPKLGGSGHTAKSAIRHTKFQWTLVAVTPPKTITGAGGERPLTPRQHLRRVLGYDDAAEAKDTRLVLLYFHWPHKDPTHGERTTDVCNRVLEHEQLARWSRLFRTVRVEMEKSHAKTAASLGAGDGPSFAVLDADLSVVAKIEAPKSSNKLMKRLRAILEARKGFDDMLAGRTAQQEQQLEAAKRLEKKERYESALWFVEKIVDGDHRVDASYDRALELQARLERKLDAQKAEKAAKAEKTASR